MFMRSMKILSNPISIQFRKGWLSVGWPFFLNIENRTVSWASANCDDHICNQLRSSWCWERISTNTGVTDVNTKEQSIRIKRLVRDHMQKHNLQPATTEITNVLKKSCHAAYQQYRTYLDEEKKRQQKTRLTSQNRFWIRKLRKLKVRSTI